jgi:hypothetical protein
VLLDEDVPRRLKRELTVHEVRTVVEMGWTSIKNGVLLGLAAAAGFDVLLTCDRNMAHQQDVSALDLALVVLAVPDKRMQTILPLVPDVLTVLDGKPQPGTFSVVGSWRV